MRRLRRSAVLVAASFATALLGQAAAVAQPTSGDVHFVSPREGATITGRVSLDVRVDVGPIDKVDVRLSQDGASIASGTAFVSLPCVEGCDEGAASTWGGRTFDAQLGAPFSPRPQCNGRWLLQPRIDGGQWLDGSPVLLSAPPASPSDLKIQVGDDVARLTWKADRSPDVVFHRIERSTGGGPFTVIATLAGSVDAYEDDDLPRGDHAYRVVAARPDGLVNGSPATPCTDNDADLLAASRNVVVRNDGPPAGSPGDGGSGSGSGSGGSGSGSNSGSGSGGSGSSGSGSGSSGGSGSDGGDGSGTDAGDGGGQGDGTGTSDDPSAEPSPRPTRQARPVPPPPSAERRTSASVEVPSLQQSQRGPGEDDGPYYGEDMEFSEEIDYGDAPEVAGEPEIVGYDEDGEPIYETVRQPGEIVAFGVVALDSDKLRTLALGLLLATLALHGRRWVNS